MRKNEEADAHAFRLPTKVIYNHLTALSNHYKHQHLIDIEYKYIWIKETTTETEKVEQLQGASFASFIHQGKQYPSKNVYEFLKEAHNNQIKMIIKIGRHLTDLLKQ